MHTHTNACVTLPSCTHTHTVADLSVSRVTCSRVSGSSDFSCPFHVISDNILEAAEYLIFILSVIDGAGHSITVDRNCANGVILFTSTQGTLSLEVHTFTTQWYVSVRPCALCLPRVYTDSCNRTDGDN